MAASSQVPSGASAGVSVPGPVHANTAIRAAGGAVWRRLPTGTEIVLVFRPRYGDWGLPKGKALADEADEVAAMREVHEETGLQCRLGPPLPSTTYPDADGHLKTVRYWAMTVDPGSGYRGGPLQPLPDAAGEVGEAVWLPIGDARKRLTYARDVVVIDALVQHLETGEIRGAPR